MISRSAIFANSLIFFTIVACSDSDDPPETQADEQSDPFGKVAESKPKSVPAQTKNSTGSRWLTNALVESRSRLMEGKPEEALVRLEEARISHGANGELLRELSTVKVSLGDKVGAASDLRLSVELEPLDAMAHFDLALLCEELGPKGDVETHYLRSIDIDPDRVDSYLRLGSFYMNEGRVEEAIIQFDEVLIRQPRNFQAALRAGVVLASAGRPMEAIPRFEKAYEIRPKDQKLAASLALACWAAATRHVKEGRPDSALKAYERAVEVRPDWPEASRHFAWFLATFPDGEFRDASRAVKLAESSERFSSGLPDVLTLDALAASYAEAGRFEEAENALSQALELAAENRMHTRIEKLQVRLRLYRDGSPFRGDGTTTLADG